MDKLLFLTSVRFWKLAIAAVVQLAGNQGYISIDVANAISLLLLGSVAVRTIDKASENLSG